jgi:hypothetical protein
MRVLHSCQLTTNDDRPDQCLGFGKFLLQQLRTGAREHNSTDNLKTENVLMIGRIFGRKEPGGRINGVDKPIVHQSVPDEVLNKPAEDAPPADMSWMDSTPIPQKATQPQPEVVETVSESQPEAQEVAGQAWDAGSDTGTETPKNAAANPPTEDRVKYPHGWLVVVEGAGVGEWFVLEGGVSHIGREEGQTVRLDYGDSSIAPVRHAELTYNEKFHVFELGDGGQSAVRLNGTVPRLPAKLRDGDVISVGETSLRLVGLCTPNFNWN